MELEEKQSATEWADTLKLARKEYKTWETKGDKIVKRYRDERGSANSNKRYNILWSNIRTLFPAIYSRKPKAQCDRRYKDKDPVGRTAAQILERALQYEIDHYSDYDSSIKNALMDRLLPGRGISWVRYEPTYAQEEAQGEDAQLSDDVEQPKEITHETSPCDYVFWKDFYHSPARTWEEVTWVARRVYLDRDEGIERFGDDFKNVPLAHEPKGLDDVDVDKQDNLKKAIIFEIWDKATGTAIWIAEGFSTILDTKSDPLQLENFFPCPKPLLATTTTDSLIPVADFIQYQDQANELDELTDRISKLAEACKVVGVFDASQPAISRMLNEGTDNTLIPVDSWAAFGEKGGLKGSVDWLPLDMVVGAISQLYIAREQCKSVIFEITGLSDIIRGATVAGETATAQRIKSQFASLRLKELQNNVAIFASDLLRIKAQIMCNFYQPETLIKMSGIMNTEDAQFAEQAIAMLKDNALRDFSIEVATDSLVELDEQGEQESRMMFLQAVGGFLKEAINAPPQLAPLLGEMLLFGVRGFKVGRDIENAFDEAMAQMRQPQQPKPDPEQMKLQAQMQLEQGKAQLADQQHQRELQANAMAEQQSAQVAAQLEAHKQSVQAQQIQHQNELEAQREQQRAQLDAEVTAHKAQIDADRDARQLEFERWKVEFTESTKILVAQISAKTTMDTAALSAQQAASTEVSEELGGNDLADMHSKTLEALTGVMQQLAKPKTVIRGDDGKVIGVQ